MSADPYRPFQPRLARLVAGAIAVLVLVLAVVFVVLVPGFGALDRAGTLALGFGVAALCLRHATVRAVPDQTGLVVRNLVFTRRLEWVEILGVSFGAGGPWATLDLADGTTLAVMGIQRSDGELATAETRRLATLIQVHGEAH